MRKITLFLIWLFIATTSPAITYYIAVDGSDEEGCGTLSKPFASMAAALTNAVSGDTIRLGEGVFPTAAKCDVLRGFSLTILGAGRDKTILKPASGQRLFEINGGGLTLKNLSVTGTNNSQEGGAIIAKSLTGTKPRLVCEQVDFTDNSSKGSPAVRVEGGTARFLQCNFLRNTASSYGAISLIATNYSFDQILISGCLFEGNTAGNNGSALRIYAQNDISACLIVNNTFANNRVASGYSGTIAVEGGTAAGQTRNIHLCNNTIAGNTTTGSKSSGLFVNATADGIVSLTNNIILDNTNSGATNYAIQLTGVSLNQFTHNIIDWACRNVGDVLYGYNKVTDVPAVVNTSNLGGYTAISLSLQPLADNGGPSPTMSLAEGSKAIDAGKELDFLTTDQRGYLRTGKPDSGAYEFNGVSSIEKENEDVLPALLYPNPVRDILFVSTPVELLEIYTPQGVKVAEYKDVTGSVDLRELPVGSYVVRVMKGEEGWESYGVVKW